MDQKIRVPILRNRSESQDSTQEIAQEKQTTQLKQDEQTKSDEPWKMVEEYFVVLIVEIPIGRQIRFWLAEKLEFLPIIRNDMIGNILAVDLALAKVKELIGINSFGMEIIEIYLLYL